MGGIHYGRKILPPSYITDDMIVLVCTEVGNYIDIKAEIKKNCEIIHMCPPFRNINGFLDNNFISEYYNRIYNTYSLLSDEKSRNIFVECVNSRITGNFQPLENMISGENWFDCDFIKEKISDGWYIDCGAYTGDTYIQFLYTIGYRSGCLIDLNEGNCFIMKKIMDYLGLKDVMIINKGTDSEQNSVRYNNFEIEEGAYENAAIGDFRNVPTTIHKVGKAYESMGMTDTLDNIIAENNITPSLIKINTVTNDLRTLIGCVNTMKKYNPIVCMELGIYPKSFFEIPLIFLNCNPEYQLFIRVVRGLGGKGLRTVLYAI